MKAVAVANTDEYGIEDIEFEAPKASDIKVKLEAAGLCHSDLSLINGTLQGPSPLVLGRGVDIVLECVGVPALTAQGLHTLHPGGTLLQIGVPSLKETLPENHQLQ